MLFLQKTSQGQAFISGREGYLKGVKFFLAWSILYRINNYLNWGAANNWTHDYFKPSEEIVLITGGSGGIGSVIVQEFAAMGIKVVVLDVQPMTYETREQPHKIRP